MVGIGYSNRETGGSERLSRVVEVAVAPQFGDRIELLPAVHTPEKDVSAWHGDVTNRWLHTSTTPAVEVLVQMPRGALTADEEADLRAGGWS